MMTARRGCRIVVMILSAAAAGGCSAKPGVDRPKLVPARGVVRYNGKPLDGARVTFANTAAGISAYAVTSADGTFTLTTFQPDDGAVPGKYKVAVSKAEEGHRTGAKDAPPVFRSGAAPHPRFLIPQHYSNLATSGLTAEVPENGSSELVVELK